MADDITQLDRIEALQERMVEALNSQAEILNWLRENAADFFNVIQALKAQGPAGMMAMMKGSS